MIRIGLIGYGYWGPKLLRNFLAVPGAEVAMVVDLAAGQIDTLAQSHPTLLTALDPDALIADASIDAVVIATPVESHFELALAALKAGKHVWLEKPMAASPGQALALIEAAERHGRVLMVDHTTVYASETRALKELLAADELGRVLYYDSMRSSLGLVRSDANVIADLAVHDFALLDYLFSERPMSVSACGIGHFDGMPENIAYVTLHYSSGAIAHVNTSWVSPVRVRRVLIGGSRRMALWDDDASTGTLRVHEAGVDVSPMEAGPPSVLYRQGEAWMPPLDTAEALQVAARHFADCIRSGRTPVTDGRFGLRMVDLAEKATVSLRSNGTPVWLDGAGGAR